jgi:hypothetical protein
MSSPHTAGAALLLKALHTDWTPSQIRSALMTTAVTDVVKEDRVTPADPFDMGAGRIDLHVAGAAGLTFDETAANYALLAESDLTAVHLNLPSINAPVLPGRLETTRTATNVTNKRQRYSVEVTSPDDSKIVVKPNKIDLKPGQSVTLKIVITTRAKTGVQQFGEIRLIPQQSGHRSTNPPLHLPVAFVPNQGDVTLTSTCEPDSIRLWGYRNRTTECTITAQNNAFADTTADLRTSVNDKLQIVHATGAVLKHGKAQLLGAPLAGQQPGTPAIAPGELFGYIPLTAFGITPEPIGDEAILNFDVPEFVYAGKPYSAVGVDSNGYLIVGGGTGEDNEC